ncbi:hypothetical protein SK128_018726 [Halocaridina rubra]|uniref:Uncharacterized protein n=1 Tax=Halocaridina rubra TaxID=373956 RepID=A0AAN8WWI2_HALRR
MRQSYVKQWNSLACQEKCARVVYIILSLFISINSCLAVDNPMEVNSSLPVGKFASALFYAGNKTSIMLEVTSHPCGIQDTQRIDLNICDYQVSRSFNFVEKWYVIHFIHCRDTVIVRIGTRKILQIRFKKLSSLKECAENDVRFRLHEIRSIIYDQMTDSIRLLKHLGINECDFNEKPLKPTAYKNLGVNDKKVNASVLPNTSATFKRSVTFTQNSPILDEAPQPIVVLPLESQQVPPRLGKLVDLEKDIPFLRDNRQERINVLYANRQPRIGIRGNLRNNYGKNERWKETGSFFRRWTSLDDIRRRKLGGFHQGSELSAIVNEPLSEGIPTYVSKLHFLTTKHFSSKETTNHHGIRPGQKFRPLYLGDQNLTGYYDQMQYPQKFKETTVQPILDQNTIIKSTSHLTLTASHKNTTDLTGAEDHSSQYHSSTASPTPDANSSHSSHYPYRINDTQNLLSYAKDHFNNFSGAQNKIDFESNHPHESVLNKQLQYNDTQSITYDESDIQNTTNGNTLGVNVTVLYAIIVVSTGITLLLSFILLLVRRCTCRNNIATSDTERVTRSNSNEQEVINRRFSNTREELQHPNPSIYLPSAPSLIEERVEYHAPSAPSVEDMENEQNDLPPRYEDVARIMLCSYDYYLEQASNNSSSGYDVGKFAGGPPYHHSIGQMPSKDEEVPNLNPPSGPIL